MTLNFQPRKQKGAKEKPPRKYAIKEIKLHDGTIIGVFEGDRSYNKDHDILIKYQEDKKRIRTPKTYLFGYIFTHMLETCNTHHSISNIQRKSG